MFSSLFSFNFNRFVLQFSSSIKQYVTIDLVLIREKFDFTYTEETIGRQIFLEGSDPRAGEDS